MKKELIAAREPKSPISELFRTLRTNIQFMNTNWIKILASYINISIRGKKLGFF